MPGGSPRRPAHPFLLEILLMWPPKRPDPVSLRNAVWLEKFDWMGVG